MKKILTSICSNAADAFLRPSSSTCATTVCGWQSAVALLSTVAEFANSLAWVQLWVQLSDPIFQISGNTCLSIPKRSR